MKINRVEVTNFRSHEKKAVDWKDGINLLLGQNGTGKSSLLEALGIALFKVDGRSNLQRAVAYGKDWAQIVVEFTASDGVDYVVERVIGSRSSHVLYPKDRPREKLVCKGNTASFWERIRELVGLKDSRCDIATVYRHVITAYQNAIVDSFLQNDQAKQNLFNSIFNTEIYRTLNTGVLATLQKEYATRGERLGDRIASRAGDARERSGVAAELNEAERALAERDQAVRALAAALDARKAREKELQARKTSLEQRRSELTAQSQAREKLGARAAEIAQELAAAQKSLGVVEAREDEYRTYLAIKGKLDALLTAIDGREKAEAAKTALEKEALLLGNEREKLRTDMTHHDRALDEKREAIKGEEEELGEAERAIDAARGRHRDAASSRDSLVQLKRQADELAEEKRAQALDEGRCRSEAELLRGQLLPGRETLEASRDAQLSRRASFEKDRETLQALRAQRSGEEGQLDFLRKSRKKLSTGTCPFLKEECRNIKEAGSPSAFFDEHEKLYRERIAELDSRITALEGSEAELQALTAALAAIAEQFAGDDRTQAALALKEKDCALAAEKAVRLALQEKQLCSGAAALLPQAQKPCGIDECSAAIDREAGAAGNAVTALESELKSLRARAEGLQKKIRQLSADLEKTAKARDAAAAAEAACSARIEAIRGKAHALAAAAEDLPSLKAERDDLRTRQKALQEAYDEYLGNLGQAKRSGELEAAQGAARGGLQELEEKIRGIEEQVNALAQSYRAEDLSTLEREIAEAAGEHARGLEALGELKGLVKAAQQAVEKNEELLRELESLKAEKRLVDEKQRLTGIFRDEVNGLGKHVSETLMQRVAAVATENFRRLTGRAERIAWENRADESYAVLLVKGRESGGGRTSFRDLSGGEQVIVALSMRAAITSILTCARFSVFDEPTVNLDRQKKEALALYMKDMLTHMDQAIIVTHDGTFEEMAKHVVRL